MYALILVDEIDPVYSTLQVFDSSELWDWAHQQVDFGTSSSVVVELPAGLVLEEGGTSWEVTCGSPFDDLLQAASGTLPESAAVAVPATGRDDADDWRERARALCAARGIPPERIAAGCWY